MPTTQENLLKAIADAVNGSNNPKSVILIDDTDEHTGPFYAIGATIYGNFASIELDSGKVLAYSR